MLPIGCWHFRKKDRLFGVGGLLGGGILPSLPTFCWSGFDLPITLTRQAGSESPFQPSLLASARDCQFCVTTVLRAIQRRKWGCDLSKDIQVLALVKGEERYLFLYNDATKSEVLRTLGKFASNPELSFNWYDAAVLGQKVRVAKSSPVLNPIGLTGRFELPPVSDLFPAE